MRFSCREIAKHCSWIVTYVAEKDGPHGFVEGKILPVTDDFALLPLVK